MNRYVLSSEAQDDLSQVRTYYEQEAGAHTARRVLQAISRAFELLAELPDIGHHRPDLADESLRFWQVFSYLIVYDPATRPVGIARVLHSSRDVATILTKR